MLKMILVAKIIKESINTNSKNRPDPLYPENIFTPSDKGPCGEEYENIETLSVSDILILLIF